MSVFEVRSCPSYPGYQATSDSRIYSNRTRAPIKGGGSRAKIDPTYKKELSQQTTKKGYKTVCVTVNGKSRPVGVHRLVLDAFNGPAKSGEQGRHLDGNPANNTPGNLSWGTSLDNASDRMRHGRYFKGQRHHNAKLTDSQVAILKALRIHGLKVKEIAAHFGVGVSTVEDIIYGKSRKCIRPAHHCNVDALLREREAA
ncbi:HNH endonuclease [uncultured Alcanivorax sp.]|uniref:HNH endonuclease n=1 Tax=uncultured Alcanivorax sp. TaxID=191215 RepID=UPI0032B10C20